MSDLDDLIATLKQAIEYPSPSSADPYSEPICIIVPTDAQAILARLVSLRDAGKELPDIKGSYCDPECEGRCKQCPDIVIRELRARAAALEHRGNEHLKAYLYEAKRADELQADRDRLRQEVEMLRRFGNKDCTAMADDALDDLRAKGVE